MIKCCLCVFNAREAAKHFLRSYGIDDKRPNGCCTVVFTFTTDITEAMILSTVRKAREVRRILRNVAVNTYIRSVEVVDDEP